MVRAGELGRLLKIVAEYSQGYAVDDVEVGSMAAGGSDRELAGRPRGGRHLELHGRYRHARSSSGPLHYRARDRGNVFRIDHVCAWPIA